MQEERLHLIDTAWRNEDEIENSEKAQLQIEAAIAHVPKRESAKKSCKYVENDPACPGELRWANQSE